MNTPYVKRFDDNGNVTNPIIGKYVSEFPNRKQHREPLNRPPLFGCGKNHPLTVYPTSKYLRVRQFETDKDGYIKIIEHYLPA